MKSPQIAAHDILREDIHSMSLERLEEYLENLGQAMLALANLNTRPDWMSSMARMDIRRLIAKIEARIEDVLALIQEHKVEAAHAANQDDRGEKTKVACRPFVP